jgi:Ca-activated chloride channel family protein
VTDSFIAEASRRVQSPTPHPQPIPQNTERYPNAQINGFKQVSEQPVSTFAMENDTASYANSRRFLNEGRLPPTDAVRVEEFLNYFHYDYPMPRDRNLPFSTNVVVTPSPWSSGKQIIHVGLQGYDTPRTARPPLNLVLLMDVSGSMQPQDRLPLAKRAVRMMLPQLNGNDRVSMVVYAGASGVVLEPTPGNATRDIVCALEVLQSGGSTAGAEGIRLAYKMAERSMRRDSVNRVILMTDGDFNVGITDPNQLRDFVRQGKDRGIYLSVFGFGRGNYNDNMMQTLAQNGNGTAAYIDGLPEARRILQNQFRGAMFPIANDVKAQIEFNPRRVSEYRLIGYETRALNREDFNNDKVDAGEIGSSHQVTALYEITPVGTHSSVDPLRYQNEARLAPSGEIAFLRLRYKLPGQSQSRLIERPITQSDVVSVDNTPRATHLALVVAGFAQKLRNDPWIGDLSFGDLGYLASRVRNYDMNGQTAELIDLVERAGNLSGERAVVD